MGYCTVEDVKDLIKEDMYNMIIGCEYLDEEKAEEKEAKIDDIINICYNCFCRYMM